MGGKGADGTRPQGFAARARAQRQAPHGLRDRRQGAVGDAPGRAAARGQCRPGLRDPERLLRLQRLHKAFLCQRSRESVSERVERTVRLDTRLPSRRSLTDLASSDLSMVRSGFRSKREGRARCRLANPVSGPCTVVRPRRDLRRYQRILRRSSPTAGRQVSASLRDALCREGDESETRIGVSGSPSDHRSSRASHRPHSRAARAWSRAMPESPGVSARLPVRRVFLQLVGNAAGGESHRESDHRHGCRCREHRLRRDSGTRIGRARRRRQYA